MKEKESFTSHIWTSIVGFFSIVHFIVKGCHGL